MLRLVLILISAVILVVAVVLTLTGVGGNAPLYVWLAIQGAIVLIAILAERSRYRPRSTSASASWQRTGERFQDPTTKRWVVVEYNPLTGERRYVDEATSTGTDSTPP